MTSKVKKLAKLIGHPPFFVNDSMIAQHSFQMTALRTTDLMFLVLLLQTELSHNIPSHTRFTFGEANLFREGEEDSQNT
jgi:hypothetical protein